MTLENINYVAQTIGVLAILASLVFVGIQVRQNTEQARRAHLLAVSDKGMQHQDRIIALWQIAMNDARLAVPITQGHAGIVVAVDADTAAQLGAWSGAYTYAVRSWYADYLKGLIPEDALDIVEAEFCGLMAMPAFQVSWSYFKKNRFSQDAASVDVQWIARIEKKLAALASQRGAATQ
ncbi:MAG: hypothetical protein ABL871_14055 [Terricaulis sp.]